MLNPYYPTVDASPATLAGLQRRRHYIGASEAASVLGCSRYAGPVTIWAAKIGQDAPLDLEALEDLDGEVDTDCADLFRELGHAVEPVALNHAARIGILPSHPVSGLPTIVSRRTPCMAANLDGAILTADGMIEVVVEAKHWLPRDAFDVQALAADPASVDPASKVWSAYLQMQHQMYVCEARRAVLVALCGKRVAHAWVAYDPAGAEYIAERCVALWHHVETGTRPPAAGADLGELRKLPRVVATVDRPDLAPVLARYIAAGASKKAAERERDNLAAQIRDALDSASALTAGNYRATRTSNDRLTVTQGE
jgi:hypothetical protein